MSQYLNVHIFWASTNKTKKTSENYKSNISEKKSFFLLSFLFQNFQFFFLSYISWFSWFRDGLKLVWSEDESFPTPPPPPSLVGAYNLCPKRTCFMITMTTSGISHNRPCLVVRYPIAPNHGKYTIMCVRVCGVCVCVCVGGGGVVHEVL